MRQHTPVLLQEVLHYLSVSLGGKYIDATLGMAGHALEIVKRGGVVLGIDRDPSAAQIASSYGSGGLPRKPAPSQDGVIASDPELVEGERGNLKIAVGNFKDIKRIALREGFENADGILFDLGLGSHQLDDPERGFSFQKTGPLDMRYDRDEKLTAWEVVNKYSENDLVRIFKEYGEEMRFAKKISRRIAEQRKRKPLQTTSELFKLIKHPNTARRVFQALRIEVNQELQNLETALPPAVDLLKKDGRLVVISFHSLEDRIVKHFFKQQPELKILTKKPIRASETEIRSNPRAKSAKLRAALKINH